MLQSQVIDVIETFAPLETQLSYDKCGLKTGNTDRECKGVLVCLDLNEAVVDEAVKKRCDLIIEHHPTIWQPWSAIDVRYPKVKALLNAVKNEITVYSAHTNIDMAPGGLNDYFAHQIGLTDVETYGEGRIGKLKNPIRLREYAELISKVLSDETVRFIGDGDKMVKNVACINGAGGGSEETVLEFYQKTDVFVTGEVKYNVARLSKDIDYDIIEVSHYAAEKGFSRIMKDLLKKNMPELPVFEAESLTNPYQ